MAGQRVLVRARDVAVLIGVIRDRSIPLNKEQLEAYGRLFQAVDRPILNPDRGHTVSYPYGEEETTQDPVGRVEAYAEGAPRE